MKQAENQPEAKADDKSSKSWESMLKMGQGFDDFCFAKLKAIKNQTKPETEPVTHQEDHCLTFKFTIYCSCSSKSIKET